MLIKSDTDKKTSQMEIIQMKINFFYTQASFILVLSLFANTVGAVSTIRSRLGSSNTSAKILNQQKKETTRNDMGITLNVKTTVRTTTYTLLGDTCVNAESNSGGFEFDKRYIGGYHSTGIIASGYLLVSAKYYRCPK